MAAHLRSTIVGVVLLLFAGAEASAQRCAGVPTYAARRVTVGGLVASVPEGAGEGIVIRAVRGSYSLDARYDNVTARARGFPDAPAGLLGVTSNAVTARRTVASGDGQGALCFVADLSARQMRFRRDLDGGAVAYHWSSRTIAFGVGYAMPARLTAGSRAAIAFEYRLQLHWVNGGNSWSDEGPIRSHELSMNVGVDLPGPVDLSSQLLVPFFADAHERAENWSAPRMLVARLGLVVHADWLPKRM